MLKTCIRNVKKNRKFGNKLVFFYKTIKLSKLCVTLINLNYPKF